MRSLDEFYLDAFFARVDAGEEIGIPVEGAGTCRVCGCTDQCHWVDPDLCSACHEQSKTQSIKKCIQCEDHKIPFGLDPLQMICDDCWKKNKSSPSSGGELDQVIPGVRLQKDLYQKLDLVSDIDDTGQRYWDIGSHGEPLNEADMAELAEWIARELGWISRDGGAGARKEKP